MAPDEYEQQPSMGELLAACAAAEAVSTPPVEREAKSVGAESVGAEAESVGADESSGPERRDAPRAA